MSPAPSVDHLLMVVVDLDAAAARLYEEFGWATIGGGSHGAMGTANRIVPLGDQYLELIATVDPTSTHPAAAFFREEAAHGDKLLGVSLAVDDIDAIASRTGSPALPMDRTADDGTRVEFRIVGMERSLQDRRPFFIEWGAGVEYRLGREAPRHTAAVQGIAWVEVGGDVEEMRAWIGGDVEGVRLVGGEGGVHRAGIDTERGEVVI